MTGYGIALFAQHAELLKASGIPADHVRARGYQSVDTKTRLEGVGITKAGRNVPGLLVPQLRPDGSTWGHQYRPDAPRLNGNGKHVKYETPTGQRNGLDVPPGVGPQLDDPSIPLWVTEGVRKADAAAVNGLCCVALPGVWSWVGKGGLAIPDWRDVVLDDRRVVLAFDSDVTKKRAVRGALDALAGYLATKGAHVEFLHLPDDDEAKTGLDDYLADDHDVTDLWRLVKPDPPAVVEAAPSSSPQTAPPTARRTAAPRTLTETYAAFGKWLGADYDLAVLDAVLAVAAAEQLPGDPAWLLIVSGSGAAKTETVIPLAGAGGYVTSSISSEGALLSGTSTRDKTKDATGGLLRKIGSRGLLVVKDVTSILSMNRDARGAVLAALREVYDGKWERNVGTDGGRSLNWEGRLVVIGAVTTAWDQAHAVVASMGDRFLLVRLDSKLGRVRSGRQAIANTGDEIEMRAELSDVVAGVLSTVDKTTDFTMTDDEIERLLGMADVVTLARTAVESDARGNILDAHAPEMPTRFAKQLTQVVRGGLSLGMTREHALAIASRCARDSIPPLRLAVLLDLLEHPHSTTHAVRKRLDRPRTIVDRVLQSLHILGLVTVEEVEEGHGAGSRTVWHYVIHPDVGQAALADMGSTGNVTTRTQDTRKEGVGDPDTDVEDTLFSSPSDISGTTSTALCRSLSHLPGRCPSCGYHIDTQGHAGNCPTVHLLTVPVDPYGDPTEDDGEGNTTEGDEQW